AGTLAVTPDGTTVRRIGSDDIRLWRLPGLEPVRTIPHVGKSGHGESAAFSPDGRQTCFDEDDTVAVYDHQPAEAVRPLLPLSRGGRWSAARTDWASAGPVISLELGGIAVWSDGVADRISVPRGLFPVFETSLAITPTGAAAISYRHSPFGST